MEQWNPNFKKCIKRNLISVKWTAQDDITVEDFLYPYYDPEFEARHLTNLKSN